MERNATSCPKCGTEVCYGTHSCPSCGAPTPFVRCVYGYNDKDVIAELSITDLLDYSWAGVLLLTVVFLALMVLRQPGLALKLFRSLSLPTLATLLVIVALLVAWGYAVRLLIQRSYERRFKARGRRLGSHEVELILWEDELVLREVGGSDSHAMSLPTRDLDSMVHTGPYVVLCFSDGTYVPIRMSAMREYDPGLNGYRAWLRIVPQSGTSGNRTRVILQGIIGAIAIAIMFWMICLIESKVS